MECASRNSGTPRAIMINFVLIFHKGAVNAYFLTDSFSKKTASEAAIFVDSQKTGPK